MDKFAERFVGTWRLVSFVARDAGGRETDTYGDKPCGLLIYDSGGRMSVHIARAEVRPFTSDNLVDVGRDELQDAFDGYFGYFGRYTVDERAGVVTHHVEGASHPNFAGTDQRRLFTRPEDRLMLTTATDGTGSPAVIYVATWERQA